MPYSLWKLKRERIKKNVKASSKVIMRLNLTDMFGGTLDYTKLQTHLCSEFDLILALQSLLSVAARVIFLECK